MLVGVQQRQCFETNEGDKHWSQKISNGANRFSNGSIRFPIKSHNHSKDVYGGVEAMFWRIMKIFIKNYSVCVLNCYFFMKIRQLDKFL